MAEEPATRKLSRKERRKLELHEADHLGEPAMMRDRPDRESRLMHRSGEGRCGDESLTKRRASKYFKYAVGDRVMHGTRGVGTVAEHMDDGRTMVRFDNGEEHRYKPSSIPKLSLVRARNDGDAVEEEDATEEATPLDAQWSAMEWLSSLSLHEPLAQAILEPLANTSMSGDEQVRSPPPTPFSPDSHALPHQPSRS